MTESVKDEITVRIVYEGRAAKVVLNNGELEKLRAYYEQRRRGGPTTTKSSKAKKKPPRCGPFSATPNDLKSWPPIL